MRGSSRSSSADASGSDAVRMKEQTGVSVMKGLTSKHLCFSLVCNQAGGEVVTFWSKECISRGGEEHGDGRPDVDGAYLVGGRKAYLCKKMKIMQLLWGGMAYRVWKFPGEETWLLNQKDIVLDRHTKLKGGD